MDKPNKICRVLLQDVDGANVLIREDGEEFDPKSMWIYEINGESWLCDAPMPPPGIAL